MSPSQQGGPDINLMIVIYLHQFFFPSERAHTIQMLHTGAGLAGRGIDTHLFAKPNPALPVESIAAGIRFYGLDPSPRLKIHLARSGGRSRASLWSRWLALRTLVHLRRDRVIVFVRKLRTAAELARFRRLTGLRFQIVIEMHDIPSLLDRSFAEVETLLRDHAAAGRGLAEERVLRGIDGVISITDASRNLLASSRELAVPMTTIRSGVDLRAFEKLASAPVIPRDEQVVMYAGQLLPWKGVEVLVQAMAELKGSVHLEVLGGDVAGARAAEVAALAREAGVAGRVRFRGFVPHGEIHAVYRHADCLVLPNRRTVRGGFFSSPIKLFEYMASGVPVVASDLPSVRELLRHRENAILVEPDSPTALAAGLSEVLENRTLALRLANEARENVRDFSWERRTDRLVQFFERMGSAYAGTSSGRGGRGGRS